MEGSQSSSNMQQARTLFRSQAARGGAHPFPDGAGEAPGQDASRTLYVLGKVSGREGR